MSVYGTYQLPDGSWQTVAEFATKCEAEETLSFHAQGRDWKILGEKITFRPGALSEAMLKRCCEKGITPSQLVRKAVAKLLKVEEPEMIHGNPNIADHSEAGVEARKSRQPRHEG